MKPFVLDEPVDGTFWPELEQNQRAIGDYGTGYYNVMLVETAFSMTGYRFDYISFDDNGACIRLSSISLPRLRARVLSSDDLKWKVLDVEAAMKTLSLNLLDLHLRNVERARRLINENFSGVAYVRKGTNVTMNNGYLWIYFKYDKDDPHRYHFSAKTLRALKKKAEKKNAPWIIIHEEAYREICEQEELYL